MIKFEHNPIPVDKAGVGLRATHYHQILEEKPDIAWFEVHSENFFAQGGMSLYILERIRENYPLSMHGVGLSLGSKSGISEAHLKKLKSLIDRFNPAFVSEHISWSETGGIFLNDLLPVPYTEESLQVIVRNIDKMQNYLGQEVLVENPSSYLEYDASYIPEYEFMAEVARQSGCGILLDVNNIYVTAQNHKIDAHKYIDSIPKNKVSEIHLAGHAVNEIDGQKILIDHHGDYVINEVWELYEYTLEKLGNVPTLIEWDTDIPALGELMNEAQKAQAILDRVGDYVTA